ncbi:MAG: hypothetical protein MJ250_05585 [Alphaproteobacteria bacterium]|nr:hypothetical protein [Alphaproteobacteria bacterium]
MLLTDFISNCLFSKNDFPFEEFKKAIKDGADVNVVDKNENTPLLETMEILEKTAKAKRQKNQVIKILLKSGADVRKKIGSYPISALSFCFDDPSSHLNTEMVKLITSFAGPLSREEKLIRQICLAKTWEEIEPFIWNKKCYTQRFYHKKTLLMYALNWKKDISIIKKLIENGSNVKAKDDLGWTVLHFEYEDYDKIKLLLDCGANLNAVDEDGDSGLLEYLGINKDCVRILKLILNYHPPIKTLKRIWNETFTFAFKKYPPKEFYEILLKKGINPNMNVRYIFNDKSFSTALMEFTKYSKSKEHLQLLFDYGANPNITDENGLTALGWGCVESAPFYIIKLLLKNGANPNIKDIYGRTAFDYGNKELYSFKNKIKCSVP